MQPAKQSPTGQGERGPAGERGPSALISVKDRDSLFDLGPVTSQQPQQQQGADFTPKVVGKSLDHNGLALSENNKQQQQEPSGARLAFIESEQMLVVETSLGWRPVPMLAPLKDFRKTIAKFSLNSAEDRRRLLMNGREPLQQQELQKLAGLAAGRKSSVIHLNDSPMVLFANTSDNNNLNSVLNAFGNDSIFEDADEGDEDDDDDDDDDDGDDGEEDDDEDEDSGDSVADKELSGDAEQVVKREDGAENEEDDDDDEDGEDENDIGTGDYDDDDVGAGDKRGANASGAKTTRAKFGPMSASSSSLSSRAPSGRGTGQSVSDGAKSKRRRAQGSGRSAVSAAAGGPLAAAETNSIGSDVPATRLSPGGELRGQLGPSPRSTPSATGASQVSLSPSSPPLAGPFKGDAKKVSCCPLLHRHLLFLSMLLTNCAS